MMMHDDSEENDVGVWRWKYSIFFEHFWYQGFHAADTRTHSHNRQSSYADKIGGFMMVISLKAILFSENSPFWPIHHPFSVCFTWKEVFTTELFIAQEDSASPHLCFLCSLFLWVMYNNSAVAFLKCLPLFIFFKAKHMQNLFRNFQTYCRRTMTLNE